MRASLLSIRGAVLRLSANLRKLRSSSALFGVGFLVAGVALSAQASGIYWASNSREIGHANLDGTGVDPNFISLPQSASAIAVDGTSIYWASRNTISRANLDGTGVDPNFISLPTFANDIAINGTSIYWTNGSGTIGRVNLDGTGVDRNFISMTNEPGYNGPLGIAVDGTHVYWTTVISTEFGTQTIIGRANVDGTGVEPNSVFFPYSPGGPAVDATSIYWTFHEDPPFNLPGGIAYANLDDFGTGGQGAIEGRGLISGLDAPTDIAADGMFLYWGNALPRGIGRANADGTGMNPSFISTPGGVRSIAVSLAPIPEPGTGLLVIAGLLGLAGWRRG